MPHQKNNDHVQPTAAGVHAVAFVSLGCPKNLVDSEKMLGLLAEDGIAITADHDQADAIIINTCGFLEASKTESLEVIREALAGKEAAAREGRAKRIIVAGCLVQRHKTQLLEEVPGVDALVGVFDRENIVRAVRGDGGGPPAPLPETGRDLGAFHPVTAFIHKPGKSDIGKGYIESDRARLRLTPRHYAYLRVSEGCNQGCTFCTIPSIRGRMRSKPLAHILAEAAELLADGALELNLIGQDTTSYGEDIGFSAAGEGLSGLLRALNHLASQHSELRTQNSEPRTQNSELRTQPSELPWLRLMYAYPSCFTDDMIRTLADCQHVVKYIDMPLQHINDDILHAMRRKVTRRQIETLLDKLRKWVPGIALRTTFISGFPGETKAQHRELVTFIEQFGFDNLGVFEFSPEPGTPAGRLHETHPVPADTAAKRKEEIMLAQQKIVLAKNRAMVGRTIEVLVDEINPRTKTATARHAGQAPDIDGRVLLAPCSATPGELLLAQVEDFNYYDLIAKPLALQKNRKSKIENRKSHIRLPVLGAISP